MPFDFSPQPERDPILRTLLRARELLERGWCQGTLARDLYGRSVCYTAPQAVGFCLAGAVHRAGADVSNGLSTVGALLAVDIVLGVECELAKFNDHTTKAEVLAVVDKAIESRRTHLAARVEV